MSPPNAVIIPACVNHSADIFRNYIDKLYDIMNSYTINGTVLMLVDFNAKYDAQSPRSRDSLLYMFFADNNMVPVNRKTNAVGPVQHMYLMKVIVSQLLTLFVCLLKYLTV